MGKQRTRAGKYIYICIASLIFFHLSGCTAFKEVRKEVEEQKAEVHRDSFSKDLLHASRLFYIGDYEGSLKEYQNILSLSGNNPPGDQALFYMGLIYAHYKNPKKDYKRSLSLFKRLLTDYPLSPLSEQADIWVGVLQLVEESRQEVEKAKEAIEKSKQEVEKAKEAIEKSKQIDIEIEEKKKEIFK